MIRDKLSTILLTVLIVTTIVSVTINIIGFKHYNDELTELKNNVSELSKVYNDTKNVSDSKGSTSTENGEENFNMKEFWEALEEKHKESETELAPLKPDDNHEKNNGANFTTKELLDALEKIRKESETELAPLLPSKTTP